MRGKLAILGLVFILVVVSFSCGDTMGEPQPVPIPLLVRTEGVKQGDQKKVLVVGLPGVVPRVGEIAVESAAETVQTTVTEQKTFNLRVLARAGEVVAVRFEGSDPANVTIKILPDPIPPYTLPRPIPGVPPVTGPTAGVVTVRGETDADVDVVGINLDKGGVDVARSESDGTFKLELAGASGDRLEVYQDSGALMGSWALTVP